ncbi:MAG: 6-carboxytetrahydropterin synthase [Fidelibacterota bacterium]|nr:MAG: 6-carboxytetrahydropterin synthase [Candidatus Neomarinimicrobiota bacterium]
MLIITKRFKFCAAHRYHNTEWTEEQNRAIFGADHKLHGHNYDLEVSLTGPVDPATGFIADLQKVKEIVETRVIDQLDHAQIDMDIPWFKERQPSSENLVLYIWEQLTAAFPADVQLVRIRLYETPTIYAEYSGG